MSTNQIPDRLDAVRERIRTAALACGRDPDDIALLAVSKTKPVGDVIAARNAGQKCFGENYLQDALPKIAALGERGIEWHFIGRVQGNKCADISRHFAWVHGLDKLRHAELLDRHRPPELPPLQACVQVQLSGEASKSGVVVDDLRDLSSAIAALPRIRLRGLMTLPNPNTDMDRQRADFARLRALRDELRDAGIALDTLSMGMSGDLEAAIAEGATIVRVGTDIFGTRA